MASSTASRRYAQALYELAAEQGAAESVHTDLAGLMDLFASSPVWRGFVTEGFGPRAQRSEALGDVLQGRVHELTLRFLRFLDARRRLSLLPGIITAWTERYDSERSILRARVISAAPLTEEQAGRLRDQLSKRFGKSVVLTVSVEPALIGGLKVQVSDHVFDISLETQLQHLHHNMLRA
jgi:F-type H+-transporting ATPase subunit delta